MESDLFILNGSSAEPLSRSAYERESDLQKLIARNPYLISRGSQNERLYLVTREAGVYDDEASQASHYFVDDLFVSESGVPVIAEVKRSSNTELHRRVVAQMIDYACRASFWDVDKLKDAAIGHSNSSDCSVLASQEFWDTVASNLKAGKLRLVFVADELPTDLVRVINFLDEKLENIDVYGVALAQYRSNGATLIIKSVAERPAPPESDVKKQWNYDGFMAQASSVGGKQLHDAVGRIVDWSLANFEFCSYTPGKTSKFTVYPCKSGAKSIFFIEIWGGPIMRVRIGKEYNALCLGVSDDELGRMVRSIACSDDYFRETDHYFAVDCRALSDDAAFGRFAELILSIQKGFDSRM